MSGTICNDNRFDLIAKYKAKLIEATNIETSTDEIAVIDNILFRLWQMGWLDRLEQPAASPWHRVEEPPKEYGNYLAVVNGEVMEVTYSDISMRDDWNWSTCDAEGFVWIRSESVTHWMPLPEPPKEEEHGN